MLGTVNAMMNLNFSLRPIVLISVETNWSSTVKLETLALLNFDKT